MLKIEKDIYNNKKWYKKIKPIIIKSNNMYSKKNIKWLGFNIYLGSYKQRTFIFCPYCHAELISTGIYLRRDVDNIEHYRCSKCGTNSAWDFDMPTPVLVGRNKIKLYKE